MDSLIRSLYPRRIYTAKKIQYHLAHTSMKRKTHIQKEETHAGRGRGLPASLDGAAV
jgi:hypothetical protein